MVDKYKLDDKTNPQGDFLKVGLIGIFLSAIVSLVFFIFSRNIFFSLVVLLIVLTIIMFYYSMVIKSKNKVVSTKVKLKVSPKIEQLIKPFDEFDIEGEKKQKELLLIKTLHIGILAGLFIGVILQIIYKNILLSAAVELVTIFLFYLYFYFSEKLKESDRVKRIEMVFPDFLQLMSSNLRAGMTVDRSIFLSAREEFTPLDKEILKTGKDITTGKSLESSLIDMGKRIKSHKIEKVVLLIISGIKAGGNLATLLEETSVSLREREFIEKKAASNVLMYVIFIFLTVSMGAPALFGLSTVLVDILSKLLGNLPEIEANASATIPFTLSSLNISTNFIMMFSIVFIVLTDILASLTLGLVNKGEEKEGLKFLIPLIVLSLTIFFTIRFALSGFMAGLFG